MCIAFTRMAITLVRFSCCLAPEHIVFNPFALQTVVMHKEKEENGLLSHMHHHDAYRSRELSAFEHSQSDGDMFLQVSALIVYISCFIFVSMLILSSSESKIIVFNLHLCVFRASAIFNTDFKFENKQQINVSARNDKDGEKERQREEFSVVATNADNYRYTFNENFIEPKAFPSNNERKKQRTNIVCNKNGIHNKVL